MGVYKDYYVGDCLRQRQGLREEGPSMGIGVEDDDEERGWRACGFGKSVEGSSRKEFVDMVPSTARS